MDASRLIEAWSERDARYSVRWTGEKPAPLSGEECAAIVCFRIAEALMVPAGKGRNACLRYIEEWSPPAVSVWRSPLDRLDADNERHRARWRRRNDERHVP